MDLRIARSTCVLPLLLSISVLPAIGCGKKSSNGTGSTSVTSSLFAKSGLHAEGNNADLVSAAEKVLAACGADFRPRRGFDDCPALDKDFREMKIRRGREDKTFIAFLEDPDEKVRALGVKALHAWGDDYKTDKDLAARLVGALEKETCPAIDGAMADLVADLNPADVGLGARIQALAMKAETTTDVKSFLVTWWGQDGGGDKNTFAYELSKHYATSTEKRLKLAALEGYSVFFATHTSEACGLWFDLMKSDDTEIAARSTGQLTGGWTGLWSGDEDSKWQTSGGGRSSSSTETRCKELDAALGLVLARAKAGKIDDATYVQSLGFVLGDKHATVAQKGEARTAMHAIIENKDNGWRRGSAITELVRHDPSQRSYVARFAKDKELASYVKSALEQKKT